MEDKKPKLEVQEKLSSSDAGLVRVLEDLIDILITNGTIRMTDLPPKALEKLSERKQARQKLTKSLDLINHDDEDEGSII